MGNIKIELDIPKKRIADLLLAAFEGGSNYWYVVDRNKCTEPPEIDYSIFDGDSKVVFFHIHYPLSEGGSVCVMDREDDEKEYTLDLKACIRGLKVMFEKFPNSFGEWIRENDDANTGDVFLQCCLFGDLIYS